MIIKSKVGSPHKIKVESPHMGGGGELRSCAHDVQCSALMYADYMQLACVELKCLGPVAKCLVRERAVLWYFGWKFECSPARVQNRAKDHVNVHACSSGVVS